MDKRSDSNDPRGLIWESYRIDGIDPESCRSIFFDWALGLPDGIDLQAAAQALSQRFAPQFPDHPMTAVLREAQTPPGRARSRRRGRSG